MDFTIIRLLFDFGLLILIWIVQLIIYPSFKHFQKQDLMRWHSTYTTRIGIIVMPLMIGQLALSVIQAYAIFDFYSLIDLLFIIGVWMSTFLQFVPLHTSISNGDIDKKLMNRLTSLNWLRTLLWTLIFFWSLYIMV